jgi:co-chaperonin GroES (HSP10)
MSDLKEKLRDSVVLFDKGLAHVGDPPTILNTSGIAPFDKRVLVLHDKVEEKVGSILLPPSEVDKKKYAQTTATVVAVGAMAFAEPRYDAQQWGVEAQFPEPGDRVLVGRYSGDVHKGADGTDYVLLNDSDILAFIGRA